jgi:5-methylcytosine-specific restriction endonuclease McrBC GTP-binding regulatory subunit McrB
LQRFFDSKDEDKYKGDIKARYLYESLINAVDIKKLGENASTIADKLKSKGFDKTAYVTEANCMYKIHNWLKEEGYLVESNITYEFLPQVFTNAYIKAWKTPEEKVYLIIEEINRGNCAQIFGDLFQLLDRKNGVSEYPVKADKDLADYLKKELGAEHEGIANGELKLPSNLIIYATMNTSDQSLFPMDSAFKRRWDWEYVPINYSKDIDSSKFIIEVDEDTKYSWVEFLKSVNDKIYDATNSEDKQMGNFFIKKSIDADTFVNKVMFYLWNEVCKEEYGTNRNFFRREKDGKEVEFKFTELFGSEKDTILNGFMNSLNAPGTNKEAEHKGE